MLRISVSESTDAVVLMLEGKLLLAWLNELRKAIGSATDTKRVILDLSGLSFVDSAGAHLLATLERNGVALRAPSALITALIAAAV